MPLIRIQAAQALSGFRLRLTLTDGRVLERDVRGLLVGPVFQAIRESPERFAEVRVAAGTVVWDGGGDLDPDLLIWGGLPPMDDSSRLAAKEPPQA
jgi:hypothetical protein